MSVTTSVNDSRLNKMTIWLQLQGYQDFSLSPASNDASFRRYFRMTRNKQESLIVMDAPPEKESLESFIQIANDWALGDVSVPKLYECSRELGFLVLEDLGSTTFLNALNGDVIESLYKLAIDELVRIQSYAPQYVLPEYSQGLLDREMQLFIDWFVIKHCGYTLSDEKQHALKAIFSELRESALQQTKVSVHRDYHSRNLMLQGGDKLGVIDFQDAVFGPVSYDIASLLKDCYKKLESGLRDNLLKHYWTHAIDNKLLTKISLQEFTTDFDLMGVQRHIKAIGIFCRLYHRDGKSDYLNDIPCTASYICELKQSYPQLDVLVELLEELIPLNFPDKGYTT